MPIEKLEKHEIFGLLNPTQIKRLSAVSGVSKLKEGDKIYSEGVPASHVFILLKGRVELKRPAKEKPGLPIDDITPGNIFGVSSLMGIDRYLLSAECMEDSEVLRIESKVLRQVLDENPLVGYVLQQRLSKIFFKRYLYAMDWIQTLAKQSNVIVQR